MDRMPRSWLDGGARPRYRSRHKVEVPYMERQGLADRATSCVTARASPRISTSCTRQASIADYFALARDFSVAP
jgi:hypothetical protein